MYEVLRSSKFLRICERGNEMGPGWRGPRRAQCAVALATASHPNYPSTGQQTALRCASATVQAHRGRECDGLMGRSTIPVHLPLNLISLDGFLKAELALECPSSIFPGRKMLEPFGGPMLAVAEGAVSWAAAPAALATACDTNAAGFFTTRLPVRLHV